MLAAGQPYKRAGGPPLNTAAEAPPDSLLCVRYRSAARSSATPTTTSSPRLKPCAGAIRN